MELVMIYNEPDNECTFNFLCTNSHKLLTVTAHIQPGRGTLTNITNHIT